MISMKSNTSEELSDEQKATLEAIEAESKTEELENTPEETPKEEIKEEVKEEVKVEEEVKPTPEADKVMPDPDEDVDEDEPTDIRQPKFVRLEKHLKMRDKVKDLEEELMALKSKPQDTTKKEEEVVDEIKAYSEENGYDAEQTKKLVEIIEKGAYSRLSKQFEDKFAQLNEVSEKAKRENAEVEQERIWNKQYGELLEQFGSEKEHIESIKSQIKKLAWTKEFHQAPISAVYTYLKEVEGMKPATKNKTVESGTGGQDKGGIDYARIIQENDEEAITNMSTKDFDGLQAFIKANNL